MTQTLAFFIFETPWIAIAFTIAGANVLSRARGICRDCWSDLSLPSLVGFVAAERSGKRVAEPAEPQGAEAQPAAPGRRVRSAEKAR